MSEKSTPPRYAMPKTTSAPRMMRAENTPVSQPMRAAGMAAQPIWAMRSGQGACGNPNPTKLSVTVAGLRMLRPQPPKTSSAMTTPKLSPSSTWTTLSSRGTRMAMASAVTAPANEGGWARASMNTTCQMPAKTRKKISRPTAAMPSTCSHITVRGSKEARTISATVSRSHNPRINPVPPLRSDRARSSAHRKSVDRRR